MSAERRRNPAGSRPGEASPLAVRRPGHALLDSEAPASAANIPDADAQPAGRFHTTAMVRNRPPTH